MPARSNPVQQSRERLDLLAMWFQVPRREPDNSEISPIPDQSFFSRMGPPLALCEGSAVCDARALLISVGLLGYKVLIDKRMFCFQSEPRD